MLKLLDEKELINFSIFIVWLINISGFFGILSDQKDFFLSSSPSSNGELISMNQFSQPAGASSFTIFDVEHIYTVGSV